MRCSKPRSAVGLILAVTFCSGLLPMPHRSVAFGSPATLPEWISDLSETSDPKTRRMLLYELQSALRERKLVISMAEEGRDPLSRQPARPGGLPAPGREGADRAWLKPQRP